MYIALHFGVASSRYAVYCMLYDVCFTLSLAARFIDYFAVAGMAEQAKTELRSRIQTYVDAHGDVPILDDYGRIEPYGLTFSRCFEIGKRHFEWYHSSSGASGQQWLAEFLGALYMGIRAEQCLAPCFFSEQHFFKVLVFAIESDDLEFLGLLEQSGSNVGRMLRRPSDVDTRLQYHVEVQHLRKALWDHLDTGAWAVQRQYLPVSILPRTYMRVVQYVMVDWHRQVQSAVCFADPLVALILAYI
jgi:hypothetical protein